MYFHLTNGTRKIFAAAALRLAPYPDLWVRPYITAAAATSWLAPYPELWVRPYCTVHWRDYLTSF